MLANAVEIVLRQAGSEPDEIEAACLGLGGLDTDEDLAAYTRIARRIFGSAAVRVQLENDGFIAIHAGTLGGPGIALIAGTGSMAVGVNERGERARSVGGARSSATRRVLTTSVARRSSGPCTQWTAGAHPPLW